MKSYEIIRNHEVNVRNDWESLEIVRNQRKSWTGTYVLSYLVTLAWFLANPNRKL